MIKEQGTFAFQAADLDGAIPVEHFYKDSKEEVEKQIADFIVDLYGFVGDKDIGQVQGDFKWLYDKYPRVRIGIRRALLMVDSIQRALRSSNA